MNSASPMLAEVHAIVGPVYQVGGSVRDELLGLTPKDYDFATPLSPDEVSEKIRAAGKRVYNIGKRFGTVGMKLNGQLVEITTFRAEAYREGSRHPQVEFVQDITADLARRDFTINAMARRWDGRLIDPFGGQTDLKIRLLRAVGSPVERFKEDPLRMLRTFRFASQFAFGIDPATLTAVNKKAHRILMVSRERWTQELDKLLLGDYVGYGLDRLGETQLLPFLLPELFLQVGYDQHSPYHSHDLWTHTRLVVQGTPADLDLRWAALLHDIGKPFMRQEKEGRSTYVRHDLLGAEIVARLALYLKWSNARRESVADLVRQHMREDSPLRAADLAAH